MIRCVTHTLLFPTDRHRARVDCSCLCPKLSQEQVQPLRFSALEYRDRLLGSVGGVLAHFHCDSVHNIADYGVAMHDIVAVADSFGFPKINKIFITTLVANVSHFRKYVWNFT